MRFVRAERSAFFEQGVLDDSLYEVRWNEAEAHAPVAGTQSAAGSWLIFADKSGVAEAIAKELAEHGGKCVLVRPGSELREVEPASWVIDPAAAPQFGALFAAVDAGSTTRGILHLWALDLAALDAPDVRDAAAEDLLGTGVLLHITQALARRPAETSVPLWVVTAGAEAAGDGAAVTTPGPPGCAAWRAPSRSSIQNFGVGSSISMRATPRCTGCSRNCSTRATQIVSRCATASVAFHTSRAIPRVRARAPVTAA